MASVNLSTEHILTAAQEFGSASKESQELVANLDKVTEDLKAKWSGSAQHAFYQHHAEWRMLMRGQVTLLAAISSELHALAARYQKADK
jgi:WXG100 family type VII secretion target